MSDLAIYLFARKREGRKWVRSLKIEEATYDPANDNAYTKGRTLVDTLIECDPTDPTTDQCLVIRGRVDHAF